jgi:hypothetical protein
MRKPKRIPVDPNRECALLRRKYPGDLVRRVNEEPVIKQCVGV